MKKITPTLFLCFFAITLFGQQKETPLQKFYIEGGLGSASHNGALTQISARAVFKNNWMASLSFYSVDGDPKNLPPDYEPGYTLVIILPLPDEMPSVRINLINFTGGKLFPLGRKTWATTEAGLSIVNGEQMTFSPRPPGNEGLYFPANYYSTKVGSKTAIGGMAKADLNWAFSSYTGLGLGAYANINSIQSLAGIEIKLLVGWLNPKKKAAE